MTGPHLDLDEIELELDEAVLEEIDEKAFKEHRDNRDAAVRDLLDEWLKQRSENE
jgi:metal-responsive CopG/Arc/MetJ family transcriptional regulator